MSDHPAPSETPGRRPAVPDLLAGGTFIAIGLAFALAGGRYEMGSALKMGPGYVPVALGGMLTLLGAVIAVQAFRGGDPHMREAEDQRGPVPWVRGGMLVAAIVFFGAAIEGLGLAPTLFVTTFLAALAGHRTGPLKALAIAVSLTVLSLGIFVGLLQLRLPLFGDWLGG
jgi:Tripartite tricarboxylate transporter TctB family